MKIRLFSCLTFCIFLLAGTCLPALAHNLWLNPATHYPEVGATVDIGVGWGHKFPADRVDQEMKDGRLEEIRALAPDGREVALTKVSAALYRMPVDKAGVYLVTARIKPGFFTMTPEGRKWGDKKAIANCVKCTNFHIEAKTILIAGGSAEHLEAASGLPLELIPRTDFSRLKNGGKAQVSVLFDGKPLPGAAVKATYAGFEAKDIAPHQKAQKKQKAAKKRGHHKHFPVETTTDDQGRAELKLDRAGYWIVLLSHRCPFGDKTTCDEHMYNTAFTFEVQP